jgi:hypothetical protein
VRIQAGLALALLVSATASAQTLPDRVRVELVSGVLFQGSMAEAEFQLDTTPFGGVLITRTGGHLDVDPSFSYGLRSTYRLHERLQLVGSWLHSEGRYRVTFPALASDEGDFDLEALLLAGFDFTAGQGARVSSAMSLAKSDFYAAGMEYELPILHRRFFPYATIMGGIFTQKSDGDVFQLEYEGDVPPSLGIGAGPLERSGISVFQIDSTDLLLTVGGGIRASLGQKWGVHLSLQDMMRMNADLTHIDAASTDPPDVNRFRLYQTVFRGTDGLIHNLGIQVALSYSTWPFGAPR